MRNAARNEVGVDPRQPPARRRRPARPIDMAHLGRQALGDASLELELLRIFDEIVAVHFAKLEQATSAPDVLEHVHTIKAASVGVGAWSLAEHAHILERELKAGLAVNPERVGDIQISVEEVRAFIARQLTLDTSPEYAASQA